MTIIWLDVEVIECLPLEVLEAINEAQEEQAE